MAGLHNPLFIKASFLPYIDITPSGTTRWQESQSFIH
jgi:hypothetical protein